MKYIYNTLLLILISLGSLEAAISPDSLTDEQLESYWNAIMTVENAGFSIDPDGKYHIPSDGMRIRLKEPKFPIDRDGEYRVSSNAMRILRKEYGTPEQAASCRYYDERSPKSRTLQGLFLEAIKEGDLLAVQIALAYGADINESNSKYCDDTNREIPLSHALQYSQPTVALFLLRCPNLKLSAPPYDEVEHAYLLIGAAQNDSIKLLHELIARGIDINSTNDYGIDVLIYALRHCKHDIAKYLLHNPATNVTRRRFGGGGDLWNKTPLAMATSRRPESRSAEVIALIIERLAAQGIETAAISRK